MGDCGRERFSSPKKLKRHSRQKRREAGQFTQPPDSCSSLGSAPICLLGFGKMPRARAGQRGRKKLLWLVDAHTMEQEEMAPESIIAGFRLAWGIATELSVDGGYFYEQEQLTCFQERGEPLGCHSEP